MKRLYSAQEVQEHVQSLKKSGKRIGFVPTMGALHAGHLSLIAAAKAHNDVVICSVFVNPTQFNEATDLVAYPRTVEEDCSKLESADCDVVWLPAVKDVYPEGHIAKTIVYDGLDTVMEGASRPGHFDGVVEVVARLFDVVTPDSSCFGEKDFQQVAVVQQLVKQHEYPIEIIPCAILREPHGLAMSSRNARLSAAQRAGARVLHDTLQELKQSVSVLNPDELAAHGRALFAAQQLGQLEYLDIAESENLSPIFRWKEGQGSRAFIAARFGEVRLIDNLELR